MVAKGHSGEIKIVWGNVSLFILLHLAGIYGFSMSTWRLFFFQYFFAQLAGLGVTAGAHRLWTHRSYKAKLPLRIVLMILQAAAMQNNIYVWARDHRMHHKYSDTNADPHNSKKGFFFSHIGWLMVRKHPDVIEKGAKLDLSDLLADPVVRFQKRYYYHIIVLFSFLLGIIIPFFWWGESFWVGFWAFWSRYLISLHFTWTVNSLAHLCGTRPYNKAIEPRENWLVSFLALGEGFHNYHHVFPWDYSTSEYGWNLNLTTMFIDFMSLLGLAYDIKSVPSQIVKERKKKNIAQVKKQFEINICHVK